MMDFSEELDEGEMMREDERLSECNDESFREGKRAAKHFRELALSGVPADQAIIRSSQRYYRDLVESQIEAGSFWCDHTPEWLDSAERIPADVVNSWRVMIDKGSLPSEVKKRLLNELIDYGRKQTSEWLGAGF